MSYPKIRPCPLCGSDVNVWTYETATGALGSRRAECENNSCWYMGPCCGSIRTAIKEHNAQAAKEPEQP